MNAPFRYVTVTGNFIRQELSDRVLRGESSVLLGHPNAGKGYVCRQLVEHLGDQVRGRLVRVDFDFGDAVTTAEEFIRRLQQAVIEAGGEEARQGTMLLEPLDTLRVRQPLLVANNVDSVAHHVARSFLQEVRVRADEGRLLVVLTGEFDLQELVHGPNSEFNAAGQYVLQGFELDEFARFLRRHSATRGITWDTPEESERRLWEITGGNPDVARSVLGMGMDLRFRDGSPGDEPWGTQWIEEMLANRNVASRLYRRILQHALHLVPLHPDSWAYLKKLIEGEHPLVPEPIGTPGPLTLSGLAVQENGHLRFSSDLMAKAVREHYCQRRLGDLYAAVGKWPVAIEHYRRTAPEQRLRPVTALDRNPTERILHILGHDMHAAAVEGIESVRKLFSEGCQYVLGFPEVAFWSFSASWEPVEAEGASAESVVAGKEILTEAGPRPDDGLLSISPPWEGAVLGVRLKGLWADQPSAALTGDFRGKRLLSHERLRLAAELIKAFRDAHDHAVDLLRDRQLLRFRETFERITREIVEALGSQILDVDGVLRSAATGIRPLGYRRVFFSLVDPAELNINGVWDESDDPQINLPGMSKWPLDKPTADVQPFVVSTKKYLLIEDAAQHPLTRKDTVDRAGMRGAALIPLCTGAGRVLGTFHIEREDRSPLSEEEAHEFFEFGRTLAALIEQGERIHLMQSALDNQPEPLLIVDACKRVRYGNEPASRLFPTLIPGRWRTAIGPGASTELNSVVSELTAALGDKRVSHHVYGIGADPEYRGSILAEPILNRRGELAGAFIHIQDLNYFFRVLNALGEAASARDFTSCTERLLEATRILGHRWGRLYLLNPASGELISKSQFGFQAGSKDELEFTQIRLARRLKNNGETWRCIEEKRPFVFCYSGEDGELSTKSGLLVVKLSNPDCSGVVRKLLGEYWIDLPLLAGSEAVGKISLECKADLRPEHLEFLKVLIQTASVILEGFVAREDSIRIEEAERSLAKLSHMIGTKYAWLWPALSGYKRLEGQCPTLADLNMSFERDLRELDEILSRAKEMLRGIVLNPAKFEIVAMLRECAAGVQSTLNGPLVLEVEADELLLKSAVKEIVANSLKAQRSLASPAIDVSVESVERSGVDWVRLVIADHGPGVPKGYKERIFDDFFTYDPQGQLGTGLGLGLVRRVIRAHRGMVREVGEPGEGARFELEVPRRPAVAPAA